jgi:hypothetical protein
MAHPLHTSPPRKSHFSRRFLPMAHLSPASTGEMSSVRSLPEQMQCIFRSATSNSLPPLCISTLQLQPHAGVQKYNQHNKLQCTPHGMPAEMHSTPLDSSFVKLLDARTVQAEPGLQAQGVARAQAAHAHLVALQQLLRQLQRLVMWHRQLEAVLACVPAQPTHVVAT